MNPYLLKALLSFAPGLLSHLFGGDPQKKLRQQVGQLTSAGNVGNVTNQFYQQALSSPAYAQALATIAAAGNQAQNTVGRELGARGLGTSGSAAVLSGLVPSMVGGNQAKLRTGAYGSAQEQAMQQIQQQIAALTGTQGPSQTRQAFGAGFEALGPIIDAWLKSRGGGRSPYNPGAVAGQQAAGAVPNFF